MIHPGTVLKIAKLNQRSRESEWVAAGGRKRFYFPEFDFVAEISADEVPGSSESRRIPRWRRCQYYVQLLQRDARPFP